MNSTSLRLKPLALILATAFPVFAHAAPTVSATSSYEIVEGLLPWDTRFPNYIYGGFTQNPVSTPFNESATSTSSHFGSDLLTSAYSNGSGHFGASITNWLELGSSYYWHKAQTQLVFSDAITNSSSTAQNVSFDINIDNLKFYFTSGTTDIGLSTPPINMASFSASVMVNGSTVWSSSFSANPIIDGLNWSQSGTEIGLATPAAGTICQLAHDCNFSIANYHQTIDLGPLAASDSLVVTYQIDLKTETNTYGGAPSIYFDDPAGLSGNTTKPLSASLQFAAPVPEPEQTSMLLAGLALVGAAAKRRRKSC